LNILVLCNRAGPLVELVIPGGLPEASQLPVQPGLPNPLLMLDGRHVVTAEQWYGERRPKLKRLFQHYMYGRLPAPETVTGTNGRADTWINPGGQFEVLRAPRFEITGSGPIELTAPDGNDWVLLFRP
jgi:hypothetical protein